MSDSENCGELQQVEFSLGHKPLIDRRKAFWQIDFLMWVAIFTAASSLAFLSFRTVSCLIFISSTALLFSKQQYSALPPRPWNIFWEAKALQIACMAMTTTTTRSCLGIRTFST